ncbi:hypothetical protein BDA96_05G132700 [Sorghum bicolor]|uniref:FAD-binding PCMH-type domain-containing protein n=2 Tax=Sorghum bicolor TaxID=4558 RepID=A0A921QXW4_SORBI|nr:hypothetical protein BDA96_05G132700 [Sorghum bicolor]KXG28419.1 hypothetical protein SORBI_3005G119900 [Sorghum bicolor]
MAASTSKAAAVVLILCLLCCNTLLLPCSASSDSFLQCLSAMMPTELVYQQSSSSFTSVLQSSVQNPRFVTNTTVLPLCVITASDVSHVQAAVRCGRWNGVRLRVRSGGHDYEGLSYRSVQPEVFAVLDLARLRGVQVRAGEDSAWVDAGTTLGELYYTVGTTNPGFLFPGGACPTVGVSGFVSGGGIGLMMRKYGVGGDNVVDARIVNANGDVLDRAAMGEDLFWAIRGGGGETFGVVVAWRLKLSKVPQTVTVVNILRTMEQGAADLVAKWETTILQPVLPDLTIRVVLQHRHAFFQTLFLGGCSDLLSTMGSLFPELGTTAADCNEMTWLRAMAFANYRDLDMGQNVIGGDGLSSYWRARAWAERYFMGNYRRLAAVKTAVDPTDYFRNEQSIPPLPK